MIVTVETQDYVVWGRGGESGDGSGRKEKSTPLARGASRCNQKQVIAGEGFCEGPRIVSDLVNMSVALHKSHRKHLLWWQFEAASYGCQSTGSQSHPAAQIHMPLII